MGEAWAYQRFGSLPPPPPVINVMKSKRSLLTRLVLLLRVGTGVAFGMLVVPAFAQVPAITARFEPGCERVKVLLSTPVQAASYAWVLSTGDTSAFPAPVMEVPYNATIQVALTTVDIFGESATFTAEFPAREQVELSTLEIPNLITPNGDGLNDAFTLPNGPFLGPCAELNIFDRYGHKVFEGLGNNLTWNGRTMAGEECIPAVYFYVLKVNAQEFTGHITLFR
jgi:gliding motility-associated-like protein